MVIREHICLCAFFIPVTLCAMAAATHAEAKTASPTPEQAISLSNSAYGQAFLSCFSRETLDLVRAIVTDRANYSYLFSRSKAFVPTPTDDLGFKDIATADRTPGYVNCTLTAIDKTTGKVRNYLHYNVARTNQKPYVTVYFDRRSDRGNAAALAEGACLPFVSQAMIIPSETSCLEPSAGPQQK